jgi:hypothetical protein
MFYGLLKGNQQDWLTSSNHTHTFCFWLGYNLQPIIFWTPAQSLLKKFQLFSSFFNFYSLFYFYFYFLFFFLIQFLQIRQFLFIYFPPAYSNLKINLNQSCCTKIKHFLLSFYMGIFTSYTLKLQKK